MALRELKVCLLGVSQDRFFLYACSSHCTSNNTCSILSAALLLLYQAVISF